MTRVLVVDDSRETCDLLEELLGGMGLEVVKATKPEDALQKLSSGGFSLMLSDINLEARLDGLDLLRAAKPLGIEITEVRFHRADLPFETSQAIYDRMKSERQREAKELRAQGFEWAQQIQAKADRERAVLISEAQRQSRITHGEADAKANQIFAQAFGRLARV